jgi:hypothetical protein
VHLQECFLEHILRRSPVTQEAHQEMEQLALIPPNQLCKRGPIIITVTVEQFLVGGFG